MKYLKLCVHEGIIKGLINSPRLIQKGLIISQEVKSPTKVEVTYKDKRNNINTLNLTLASASQLNGLLSTGVAFEAEKASNFKACDILKSCSIEKLFD